MKIRSPERTADENGPIGAAIFATVTACRAMAWFLLQLRQWFSGKSALIFLLDNT
jgi:hypothetical protein